MVKIAFFKEELDIPMGIDVKIDDNNKLTIVGPNGGPITKDFSHARGIKINIEGNKIIFSTIFPDRMTIALVNTIISITKGIITGLQTNYKYICKICYSHFPCSVRIDEKTQTMFVENFLGEKAPRKTKIEKNVKIKLEGEDIILESYNKESLGQTAANIKKCCRIKKKDPRVFQDGIYLYKILLGNEIIWQIK